MMETSAAPIRAVLPQPSQAYCAVVTSKEKISLTEPAAALPSSLSLSSIALTLRRGGLGDDFDDLAEAPGDPPVGQALGTGLRHPLIPPVALLAPGVAVVVVAQGLPEARDVVGGELQPPYPFGALPEVEVWHEQPRRSSVLGLQGLPVVCVDHPRLA